MLNTWYLLRFGCDPTPRKIWKKKKLHMSRVIFRGRAVMCSGSALYTALCALSWVIFSWPGDLLVIWQYTPHYALHSHCIMCLVLQYSLHYVLVLQCRNMCSEYAVPDYAVHYVIIMWSHVQDPDCGARIMYRIMKCTFVHYAILVWAAHTRPHSCNTVHFGFLETSY